jgi:hypothetical protein
VIELHGLESLLESAAVTSQTSQTSRTLHKDAPLTGFPNIEVPVDGDIDISVSKDGSKAPFKSFLTTDTVWRKSVDQNKKVANIYVEDGAEQSSRTDPGRAYNDTADTVSL